MGLETISYRGPQLRNLFPNKIRNSPTFAMFNNNTKIGTAKSAHVFSALLDWQYYSYVKNKHIFIFLSM